MAIDMNQNFSPGSKNVLVQQEVNEVVMCACFGSAAVHTFLVIMINRFMVMKIICDDVVIMS